MNTCKFDDIGPTALPCGFSIPLNSDSPGLNFIKTSREKKQIFLNYFSPKIHKKMPKFGWNWACSFN